MTIIKLLNDKPLTKEYFEKLRRTLREQAKKEEENNNKIPLKSFDLDFLIDQKKKINNKNKKIS